MTTTLRLVFTLILLLAWLGPVSAAEVERPFVLWDRADLAAMKHRIETQPWAKARWERKPENRAEEALHDLLKYSLYDDAEAGQRQKKQLMGVINSKPPLGGAQWINVIRYDMLYDLLSEEERDKVETVFREYLEQALFTNALYDPEQFNDEANYSRYDALRYRRDSWLPNIVWPRRVSANLMAAALGDEKLIRRAWDQYGSWRWYFDHYLADTGFYGEEFSKVGSTPGEMLLYCLALEHLGMNDLGFGYVGSGGATMRGHLESIIHLGYPRVDLGSDRYHYPMLTIGDLRGGGSSRKGNLPTFAFQHSIVRGYLPSEIESDLPPIQRWQTHGAWGGEVRGDNPQWDGYSNFTPKMQLPFWFELGHKRWPEAGFGYFLSQMRTPGQDKYVPSLYFDLDPIAPGDVQPPFASSWVAKDRGLAMLRADESRDYWESDAPAVSMRLAAPYAHSVNDAFALTGYYAFNRPIYLNRQGTPGYAQDWSRSAASHNSFTLSEAGFMSPQATRDAVARNGFYEPVKVVVMRSKSLFPEAGTDVERGVFLTPEYLVDITDIKNQNGKEMTYYWHALGTPSQQTEGGKPWTVEAHPTGVERSDDEVFKPYVGAESTGWRLGKDTPWHMVIEQRKASAEASVGALPKEWYGRRVGVTLRLVPSSSMDTEVMIVPTPVRDVPEGAPTRDNAPERYEVGGTTIMFGRKRAAPMVTLHEPFEGGKPPDREVTTLAEATDHAAISIVGDAVNDRVLLQLGGVDEPITVEHEGESITFADHAWVRLDAEGVHAWGEVRAVRMSLPQGVAAKLWINGRVTAAKVDGDVLSFGPRE